MTYSSQIASTLAMIKKKGVACTWRSITTTQDPVKKWDEAVRTVTETSTFIVLLPFGSVARKEFGYMQESTVPAGTLKGLVPGSTLFSPALRDEVLVGTTTYTVAKFDTINPNADNDILYKLELHV